MEKITVEIELEGNKISTVKVNGEEVEEVRTEQPGHVWEVYDSGDGYFISLEDFHA